jgi:hypothetical protein
MSQLKLIIKVTPIFYDKEYNSVYIENVIEMRDFIQNKMVDYLEGEVIKLGSRESRIKKPTGALVNSIKPSQVRKNGNTFFTSLTVASYYASWVEYGTGLHGELESPHYITTKTYHKWGKGNEPGKAERLGYMRWKDEEGEYFFKKVKGQYPKPFMRTAIRNFEEEANFDIDYEIVFKIIHPQKAKYEKTIGGNVDG